MKSKRINNGFSLVEVLMAVGILAIGMTFIAGIFPAGIYFATVATEQTIAAVAADEAFAKIQLYDVNVASLKTSEQEFFGGVIDVNEFVYPSSGTSSPQYYWSALCRKADANEYSRRVQVTVFVSRKIGAGTRYWNSKNLVDPINIASAMNYPTPAKVSVIKVSDYELQITDRNNRDDATEETFINDGYTIMDDQTGNIYRVVKRYGGGPPASKKIKLDRPWQGSSPAAFVWVVPPPVNGGRGPCRAVYQKVIRF